MPSAQPLTVQETIQFLNTALKTVDMTAIQQGRTLTITTFEKGKLDAPINQGELPELIPNNDDLVTWVVPVQHLDVVKLKQDLIPLIGTAADVAANAASNNIVITDRSSRPPHCPNDREVG